MSTDGGLFSGYLSNYATYVQSYDWLLDRGTKQVSTRQDWSTSASDWMHYSISHGLTGDLYDSNKFYSSSSAVQNSSQPFEKWCLQECTWQPKAQSWKTKKSKLKENYYFGRGN